MEHNTKALDGIRRSFRVMKLVVGEYEPPPHKRDRGSKLKPNIRHRKQHLPPNPSVNISMPTNSSTHRVGSLRRTVEFCEGTSDVSGISMYMATIGKGKRRV